jgi:hypothetical protein
MQENFSIVTDMSAAGPVHRISWRSRAVDPRASAAIAVEARASRDYSLLAHGGGKLPEILRKVNEKYHTNVTIGQATSIWSIILKEKIIKNFWRVESRMNSITAEYRAGKDILALSTKYDFPPLALLRKIFSKLDYSGSAISNIFAEKEPPRALTGRDLREFDTARANDAESASNQREVGKMAAENELAFVNYFKTIGVGLTTQDQLAAEQSAAHGRVVITPDILFNDTVYINGQRVHWIDYKDYIGTDVKFLYKSNAKQAARYVEKWGPGAMCYHHSFVQGLTFPDAIPLDVGVLPVKLRNLL